MRGHLDPELSAALLAQLMALADLVRLAASTGGVPTRHGTRPTIAVHLMLETLQRRLGAPGAQLDWAGPISAQAARAFEVSATTSPAGTIHASTDASRALLASPMAHKLLDRLAHMTADARARLQAEIPGLRTPGPRDFAPGRYDPAKLVLQLDGCGLDGNELERALIDAGMPVELADRDTVVPIVTMLDDAVTVSALVDRVVDAAAHLARKPRPSTVFASWAQGIPVAELTPQEAFFARHETVDAGRAIGRVSAELVAPYPPGVPVLVPGEVISEETLSLLRTAAEGGTRIAYAADPSMTTVQVVA